MVFTLRLMSTVAPSWICHNVHMRHCAQQIIHVKARSSALQACSRGDPVYINAPRAYEHTLLERGRLLDLWEIRHRPDEHLSAQSENRRPFNLVA